MVIKNRKIDIVIPAYKAHKKIEKLLLSIAMQTVRDEVKVTIINDCCPEGSYREIINKFIQYYDIDEIVLEKNGGPGVARQTGLNRTHNQYVVFADADDTLASAYSLESLRRGIEEKEEAVCCIGAFEEFFPEGGSYVHLDDLVWVFAKIFDREFLINYDIKFPALRANEDVAFTSLVKMYATLNSPNGILAINTVVYDWHTSSDSITRINNRQYTFDQSICGKADGGLMILDKIVSQNILSKKQIFDFDVDLLLDLYLFYNTVLEKRPEFTKQTWHYIKKYYYLGHKTICPDIDFTLYRETIRNKIIQAYGDGGVLSNENSMIVITFDDFISKLEKEDFNPNDITQIQQELSDEIKQNNLKTGGVAADYYN